MGGIKIGSGFDVHAFEKGRKLILGGVKIPYAFGLKGHSDADVLIHAVCDAILGALGRGDIGKHFPDSDPRYKNIDSKVLLDKVVSIMKQDGFRISNLDTIVILQEPKISPYTEKMTDVISKHLKTEKEKVNIKATTTEGLGFTGRKEGIACYCTVLITR